MTLTIDNEKQRYLQRLIKLINDNYDPDIPAEDNNAANNEEVSSVSYEIEAEIRHGRSCERYTSFLMTRNGTLKLMMK